MQANLREKELLITQIKNDNEKEAKSLKDSVSVQFMGSYLTVVDFFIHRIFSEDEWTHERNSSKGGYVAGAQLNKYHK